jgi:hypothetical protein
MSSCTNRIIFLPGGKTKKTTDGPLDAAEAATAVKEAWPPGNRAENPWRLHKHLK